MEVSHIDHAGRLILTAAMLRALGIAPDEDVLVEVTRDGLLIRPKTTSLTITERIAAMNLPVSDWEGMEGEIEAGRSA
jgi:bifunctional DNA-binding transcriptional regulator/antitoxin component of YhaV-PrlF toxin-antitoxin module